MKYLFSTDNTNLIITLDTEAGKYNPEITTINDPNITLENDRIWFYENGKYVRNFSFDHIGTISGVTPTSIADAFAKLNVVIDGLYLLVSPNFKGSIVPTDLATGTEDAVWIATQAGTYTNFGGVVVSVNSRAEISRVGGVFSISQTPLVVPSTKIPTWTATSFASGDQVNYLGKDWVSNAATVAGDVPGTSSKWVERLSSYMDMLKTNKEYAPFNNTVVYSHFAKDGSGIGNYRLTVEEIDNGDGTHYIKTSKLHADYTELSTLERGVGSSINAGTKTSANFATGTTAYIYLYGNSVLEISTTYPLITVKTGLVMLGMVVTIYGRRLLFDYHNIFGIKGTLLTKGDRNNERFDVSMFGLDSLKEGDAEWNMGPTLEIIFKSAKNMGIKDLYFDDGIYTFEGDFRLQINLNYIGTGKTIFRPTKNTDLSYKTVVTEDSFAIGSIQGINFYNMYLEGYYGYDKEKVKLYKNLNFYFPTLDNGSLYFFRAKSSLNQSYVTFENVNVEIKRGYIGIWGGSNTKVINCTFKASFTHVIRIDGGSNCLIDGNKVLNNQTTGIFFGSNAYELCRSNVVRNNYVSGCWEEAISFDGFGNNAGLQPILGQGNIATVSNDSNGFLKLTLANIIVAGSTFNFSTLDISKCILAFIKNTGIDGQYYEIKKKELVGADWEITLNVRGLSSTLVTAIASSVVTFSTGFLDCVIENNTLVNNHGAVSDTGVISGDYAVGISMWLNLFGMRVVGNKFYGNSRGVMYSGGSIISSLICCAFNVSIHDNIFEGQKISSIEIENGYGGLVNHFNSVTNNKIINCGKLSIKGQRDLLVSNNLIINTPIQLNDVDEGLIVGNYAKNCTTTKTSVGGNLSILNNVGIS